jgi:hypothetical protein
MKVKIGPYNSCYGLYQVARLFKYVGVSRETCEDIAVWLSETWVNDFFEWIFSKRTRKIKVHIDNYDIWNADHTMALIIHPILIKIRESKHGSLFVDDEDVPENIRSTSAKPKKDELDTDEFYHNRWEWVLDEMIYAFSTIIDEDFGEQFFKENVFQKENYEETKKRIDNGFRLFGKYYRGLWT